MIARHRYVALPLVLLTAVLAPCAIQCSSSDTPAPSTNQASGSFRGVLSGAGDLSGVLELTSSAIVPLAANNVRPLAADSQNYALSGTLTLNVPGVGAISVSGSLDLASNTATFSGTALGGTVSFRGTYSAGTLRGTATLPDGTEAPFMLGNASLGVKTYCGSFTGTRAGRWSMLSAGSQIGAVFVSSDGQAGRGLGTIDSANLATLTLEPAGSATGNVSAGSIDGTWKQGTASGQFAASVSACNALSPRGTQPDGGVLNDSGVTPDGSSPDASNPGAPEDVVTTDGTIPVGHVAVSGSRVFYTLDHPYFTGKVTIRTVGIDGSTPADVVPTGAGAVAGGLAAASGRVYWIAGVDPPGGNGNLFSVAEGGGATTDHGVIGDASLGDYVPGVPRIVTDASSVYITWDGPSNRGVRSYSLAGAAGASVTDIVGPKAVGIDGNDLWLSDFDGLKRGAPSLSPPPSIIVPRADYGNLAFVVGMAFDANNVYFATNTTNASAIWRRAKSGGALEPIVASTPGWFRSLVLLDQNLYFAHRTTPGGQGGPGSASVLRVPKTATNAQPTTVAPANLQSMATDGTWLVWGNGMKIQRLHK